MNIFTQKHIVVEYFSLCYYILRTLHISLLHNLKTKIPHKIIYDHKNDGKNFHTFCIFILVRICIDFESL